MDYKEIDAAFEAWWTSKPRGVESPFTRKTFRAGAEFTDRKAKALIDRCEYVLLHVWKSNHGFTTRCDGCREVKDVLDQIVARHAQPQGQEKEEQVFLPEQPADFTTPNETRVREIAHEVANQLYGMLRATIQEADDRAKALERRVAAVEEEIHKGTLGKGSYVLEGLRSRVSKLEIWRDETGRVSVTPPAAGADRGEKERAVVEAARAYVRAWDRTLRDDTHARDVQRSALFEAVDALDAKPEGVAMNATERAWELWGKLGDHGLVSAGTLSKEKDRGCNWIADLFRDAEAATRAEERCKVIEDVARRFESMTEQEASLTTRNWAAREVRSMLAQEKP